MNISDFQPGQIVQLNVKMNDISGSFESKVSLIHDSLLLLEPIYVNGNLVGFPKNCAVDLNYTHESLFYIWRNIRIQTIMYKKQYYHAAEIIGDAEVVNRRNNYRVYIGEEMDVSYFTEKGPKSIHTLIKDISETGFAFFSSDFFQIDRVVRLNIPMRDRSIMHLSAKIVRSVPPAEEGGETLYGCKFVERNAKLSNYLMKLQREKQKQKLDTPGIS
jgi:hypothetical protein